METNVGVMCERLQVIIFIVARCIL